jgi:3-hydroxybutyryl-CoA dehydrogenase
MGELGAEDHWRIGIVGAGVMGAGLALFLPQHGYRVKLCTRRDTDVVADQCDRNVASLVGRDIISEEAAAGVRERLEVTNRPEDLVGAELVIEAVVEDLLVKRSVLGRVSLMCGRDVILASTTSSLCVSDLADSVNIPERFLGLHFFNPVASMSLVEVVAGPRTSGESVKRANAFVSAIGKVPVTVNDVPGFIVNRLALSMCNRATKMLEDGVADVEDIDTAMRLGCSHPLGPLELGDTIGWDVVLAALENLYVATEEEEYRPRPLVRRLVERGWLGRKTGRGLYLYDAVGGRRLHAAIDLRTARMGGSRQ